MSETHPAMDVPADAEPRICERCGAPFHTDRLLALHRGLDHAGALTESERDAYASAFESETADIRFYRLQALAVLVVLYFGFFFVYAVVT